MKKEVLALSKLLHREIVWLLQPLSSSASLKCHKNIVENILIKWECIKQEKKVSYILLRGLSALHMGYIRILTKYL